VGVVRGSYGLAGWVHVQAHSGDAQVLRGARQWWLARPMASLAASIPAGAAATLDVPALVQVAGVREHGAGLVAKWSGCEDPESAQACKGWRIQVARSRFPALPAGQYYWVDLVGVQVVNRGGKVLGRVRGLRSNGAHDLLEVDQAQVDQAVDAGATPAGAARSLLLIPMVGPYIDAVDLASGTIRVDWEEQW